MSTWEELYAERDRLRAENDALKLRVAVLEKARGEAVQEERDRCEAWAQYYRSRSETDLRAVIGGIRSGRPVPDDEDDEDDD